MCRSQVQFEGENGSLIRPPQRRVDAAERQNALSFRGVCRKCVSGKISSGGARDVSVVLGSAHCILFAWLQLRDQHLVADPTMGLSRADHSGSANLEAPVLFGDAT